MNHSRQLAAIMFTDIVGFSALMGSDEQKTFEILQKNRDIHMPIISKFNGQWIKELGDGVMATFHTVSDAVNAAIEIMEACNASEFQLSIGIHSAEVVFDKGDVFGDGVNIAARIESAAPPGCIFISESVQKNISNKKDINTHFVKEAKFKNVSNPVRLYQVLFTGSEKVVIDKPGIQLQEKSIAVLPFVNMSSDPEQEYFSDGISEEIINMLAQVHELKVIGRTSSFAFKGKNMDLKVIGDQLKVKYLLEGSVRKAGNKLRITAQLIEASNGFHLYSEKFDRELEDVFAIQDEISEAILEAVKVKLLKVEAKAVFKRYTDNIEAYQYYLKGRYHFSRHEFSLAIESYHSAIELDPQYAIAYAHLSICFHDMAFFNIDTEKNTTLSVKAAKRAIQIDDQNSESQYAIGRLKMWHYWEYEKALGHLKKSLQFNPNNADANGQYGRLLIKLGKTEEGKKYLEKSDVLDPFSVAGIFYITAGYGDADDWSKVKELASRLIVLAPEFWAGHALLGSAYMFGQEYDKYIECIHKVLELKSDLSSKIMNISYLPIPDRMNLTRAWIPELEKLNKEQGIANFALGIAYFSLRDLDKAVIYWEKAIQKREGYMLELCRFIRHHDEEMREDPRTLNIIEKIGLDF